MKRCPKCNRSFPDESQKFCTVDGGLLITDPGFDTGVTIRAISSDLLGQPPQPQVDSAATSRELPDINQTIAITPNAPTFGVPRDTGRTGVTTSSDLPSAPRQPEIPLGATTHRPPPKKKSKLPIILGALAFVLLLGAGGLVAVFFFVVQPRLAEFRGQTPVVRETTPAEETTTNTTAENTNTATVTTEPETEAFVPPADAMKFANSKGNLDGKLEEHYIDFSFYYPKSWQTDPKAGVSGASNFVKVERRLPPDFTQENFAVGWYTSRGSFESDSPTFPQLVELLGTSLAKNFPEYRKVSEGPTKINSLDGYEFRFVSLSKGTEKGDIQVWGRVVFLPTGVEGETAGATLIMLATSLAPELTGVEDVGEKGEMPVILESFRFAKNH
ncbi:MAG: hypothetical protein ACREBG_11060 [Pyrinomonadaceae bacterium]